MAEHQITRSDSGRAQAPDPSLEAVAESTGGAYWWVDDARWATVLPTLPDDLVELLAPPILVGAAPVTAPGSADRSPDQLGK